MALSSTGQPLRGARKTAGTAAAVPTTGAPPKEHVRWADQEAPPHPASAHVGAMQPPRTDVDPPPHERQTLTAQINSTRKNALDMLKEGGALVEVTFIGLPPNHSDLTRDGLRATLTDLSRQLGEARPTRFPRGTQVSSIQEAIIQEQTAISQVVQLINGATRIPDLTPILVFISHVTDLAAQRALQRDCLALQADAAELKAALPPPPSGQHSPLDPYTRFMATSAEGLAEMRANFNALAAPLKFSRALIDGHASLRESLLTPEGNLREKQSFTPRPSPSKSHALQAAERFMSAGDGNVDMFRERNTAGQRFKALLPKLNIMHNQLTQVLACPHFSEVEKMGFRAAAAQLAWEHEQVNDFIRSLGQADMPALEASKEFATRFSAQFAQREVQIGSWALQELARTFIERHQASPHREKIHQDLARFTQFVAVSPQELTQTQDEFHKAKEQFSDHRLRDKGQGVATLLRFKRGDQYGEHTRRPGEAVQAIEGAPRTRPVSMMDTHTQQRFRTLGEYLSGHMDGAREVGAEFMFSCIQGTEDIAGNTSIQSLKDTYTDPAFVLKEHVRRPMIDALRARRERSEEARDAVLRDPNRTETDRSAATDEHKRIVREFNILMSVLTFEEAQISPRKSPAKPVAPVVLPPQPPPPPPPPPPLLRAEEFNAIPVLPQTFVVIPKIQPDTAVVTRVAHVSQRATIGWVSAHVPPPPPAVVLPQPLESTLVTATAQRSQTEVGMPPIQPTPVVVTRTRTEAPQRATRERVPPPPQGPPPPGPQRPAPVPPATSKFWATVFETFKKLFRVQLGFKQPDPMAKDAANKHAAKQANNSLGLVASRHTSYAPVIYDREEAKRILLNNINRLPDK